MFVQQIKGANELVVFIDQVKRKERGLTSSAPPPLIASPLGLFCPSVSNNFWRHCCCCRVFGAEKAACCCCWCCKNC
uniref:Candidate secreted effector n=1 Tax=Meloidogyne incognita TaxID=6306 RepID=A0A914KJ58_MELIC